MTAESRWTPQDPADLELLMAVDILLSQLTANLREREGHNRAAWEVIQVTGAWRSTVEYWAWLSHLQRLERVTP